MRAANKIIFKIKENGNGYGHLFAEFGDGDKKNVKEIGMVSLCNDEDIAATVISILASYRPAEGIEEKVDLIMAESEMRHAENKFKQLKEKECSSK